MEHLFIEAEKIIGLNSTILTEDDIGIPVGEDIWTVFKTRKGQAFFRSTVLSAYNNTCCITGINIPQLLQASHIRTTNQIANYKKGGEIHFTYDHDRFVRIINKLAICHSGYDFDYVNFEGPVNTEFEFSFMLTPKQKERFLTPQTMNKVPEISSRYTCNYCVAKNIETGEIFLLNDWVIVQDQRYKYHIYLMIVVGLQWRWLYVRYCIVR